MDEKKPGNGCLIPIIVFIVIILLGALGLGGESDYEKAGKEFNIWINEDPRTWTDTERQYFDDLWEWADKN